MGRILILGGGGGADLDVITATAPDVRKNKVIVDKDGEPLAGVMNEQAGGTFMPGTSDRVLVPANTFVTSAIIMKGDPNLTAGNIKKNVPIFGVMGSAEGYVADVIDLYKLGANPAGFTGSSGVGFDSNQIRMSVGERGNEYLYGSMVYNFTPYSGMSIQGTKAGAAYDGEQFIISAGGVTGGSVAVPASGSFVVRIPFNNFFVTGAPTLRYYRRNAGSTDIVITRIWFS